MISGKMSSQQFYQLDARALLKDRHQCLASSGLGTSHTLTGADIASKSRKSLRDMTIALEEIEKEKPEIFKLSVQALASSGSEDRDGSGQKRDSW